MFWFMQLKDMKKSWLLVGSISVLLGSCKPKEKKLDPQVAASLPDDFVAFYEKFHQDSAFQMTHINFPLDGYPTQADSSIAETGFRWTADKWQMHRLENFSDSLYTRDFDLTVPGVVAEITRQKDTPFGSYRRFYKRNNEWFLIFYSDMNTMKTE